MSIHDCKQRHARQLLTKKNVVAVGIGRKNGTGPPCVTVSVTRKEALADLNKNDVVPSEVDGEITDVVEVGQIRAQQERTGRHRPAPPGVSVAHSAVTAGTFGALATDNAEGRLLLLSNNHVLANSNDAQEGDSILQPGPADGGRLPADEIGELLRFVPIQFDGGGGTPPPPGGDCNWAALVEWLLNLLGGLMGSRYRAKLYDATAEENLVDAAVAWVNAPDVTPEILEIGTPTGVTEASLGQTVQKSGRTTGFTRSTVQQVDVTVQVGYGAGRTATFTNQILTGALSEPGDSGSLVLDLDRRAVGLLFAGSSAVTVVNPIADVLRLLNIALVTA